jgi:HEPN domain-containing protein
MEKDEHIKYWLQSALRDWDVSCELVSSKRYMHALFFAHLVVEKLLKAHWVKENNENFPPRLHNLNALYDLLEFELSGDLKNELLVITSWNMEARYQDHKDRFYKLCTKDYTEEKLKVVEEILICMTKTL